MHCPVPMDVHSAEERHQSLLFLQHPPTSDCSTFTPPGTGNVEPVLLSGTRQGPDTSFAEKNEERVGRDQDL